MKIWSDNMLVLANISMVDLITVCFITMACVLIMVFIIVVSSKKPKKTSKEEVKIALIEKEEKEDLVEPIPATKEPKPSKQEEIPKPKTDIEEVLEKMENELTQNGQVKSHTFEEEQEQKAIISYRELLKVAGKLKEENAVLEDALEKKEKKDFKSVQESFSFPKEEIKEETKQIEEPELQTPSSKKFHSSEFISPIYGKQPISGNTSYTGKHQKEEVQQNEFLSELKDLRKNLE